MSGIRITAALLAACLLLTAAAGCKKKKGGEEVPSRYNYTPAPETTEPEVTTEDARDFQKAFQKDLSWQKNYLVRYRYFNAAQNVDNAEIVEKRASTAFSVEYTDTGLLLYYKANGNNTDYYVIDPASGSGPVHSVIAGKQISSLSSMFMKLSNVNATLPAQSNVLYMYDEPVAGRACHKYIQRAYADAKLTETVYVWIDAEYGFAMKCEDYGADDQLKTSWEVTEFSAGGVTAEDVYVDLSAYQFTEEVG